MKQTTGRTCLMLATVWALSASGGGNSGGGGSASSSGGTVTMVGSPSAGPAVAAAAQQVGVRGIRDGFEGSGDGVSRFCTETGASAPDVLVLARAFQPDEAARCTQARIAYRSLELDGNAVVVRQRSYESNGQLRRFADGLGI